MSIGDTLWSRVKKWRPALADWDVIRDQSHMMHTLIIGGIYGSIGALAALVWLSYADGFALGIAAGFLRYAVREVRNWFSTEPVELWDGIMDLLVPIAVLAPFAACCWRFDVPWLMVVSAQVLLGSVALGYTFARPANSLYYR